MNQIKTRPNCTEALRSSAVAANEDSLSEPQDILLIKKNHLFEKKQRRSIESWESVKKVFFSLKDKMDMDVVRELRELLCCAQEFVGSESSTELVYSAALFLLDLFQDTTKVNQKQSTRLRCMFGPFSASLATRACEQVKKLFSWLSDDMKEILIQQKETLEDSFILNDGFGKNIKLTGFHKLKDDEIEFGSDDESFIENEAKLNLNYQNCVAAVTDEAINDSKERIDENWLKNMVLNYFPEGNPAGMPIDEVIGSITAKLDSVKTNDELQDELFQLLGVDCLDLIPKLLNHRRELVKALNNAAAAAASSFYGKENFRNILMTKNNIVPSYGCQVTIQSENEKQLMKRIQKEEKRMLKDLPKGQWEDPDGNTIDANQLRKFRNAQLSAVTSAPFFPERFVSHERQVQYPNVYDSYADAKKSASFIAGTKLALPIDAEHENNSKYEEITIPLSKAPPANVGTTLVNVSDLDDVCKAAFKGTKTLNRIQSIVFDTVYHTNENLLICAPTGAGKTNIAMLAVLHEVKQHIEAGVVNNSFKIVYVAPMKALASEMVRNFGRRLESLGVSVRELTGDMQLTKTEIMHTHMLVTTPEKWDVVTRKSTGDVALTQLVKLLILDEVHLLHGDRGPVLEALVARTLRQVESSQSMIRIVGLSATLPNYLDVALFLKVNPRIGLFFFDNRFRPVSLSQTFVGVKAQSSLQQLNDMDEICFNKCLKFVERGHQVMIFVHSRNLTHRTAMALKEIAQQQDRTSVFQADKNEHYGNAERQILNCRNKEIKDLFPYGFSIHHAGLMRQDRQLVEKLFSEGLIQVLVCTATLAWGVNLPAHAVIIKGTDIYDAKHGSMVDLGILDVMQIFGRAGRPQFDKEGHGIIVTSHNKLNMYLSLLTCQYPIESKFQESLVDNLNAEISLGTVSSVDEAVEWLSYTYLFVRMKKNPLVYGVKFKMIQEDPQLLQYRKELVIASAERLDSAKMIRFENLESLVPLDLGRTASHFYIKYSTIELFNETFRLDQVFLTEADVFFCVSQAEEFNQLKAREEEARDLDDLMNHYCEMEVKTTENEAHRKVNILLQTYVSRGLVTSSSLVSDQAYIIQNCVRILRALFDIFLRKLNAYMAGLILSLAKMVEKQMWSFDSPLKQLPDINPEIVRKINDRKFSIEDLKEMSSKDIGSMFNLKIGRQIVNYVRSVPSLIIIPTVKPITRTVLKVHLDITADFLWNEKYHKTTEGFWIWIEDPESNHIYHYEYFIMTRKQARKNETQSLVFTIPVSEPLPSQYLVRVVSDSWIGSEQQVPLTFQHLILPERYPPHTELLDLEPLPVAALNDMMFAMLYNFTHFNPIQTQIFHTLYHTDHNVLLGAPTGSGKTIAAEIAIFRVFKEYPKTKVVYIAPLKALVRERIQDWKLRFKEKLQKNVTELTGDVTPDFRAICESDIIVTTPEKWDGISRSWQTRSYVKAVSLIVIDEIHLLGESRGPVLEVIVSRANFISSCTDLRVRIVGLSTALANARDLADWLGIGEIGLYNFQPAVRPVPLEIHVSGFPGKHYCPRMALMNKPAYRAIMKHSPDKPVLIFVSSRRQTRLTALDLISFLAAEDNPRQWLNMDIAEMDSLLQTIKDQSLKLALAFGIGLHHAGLHEKDRKVVEELFSHQKIQILVSTATLAWGVNFPAYLVVVKGTEYYDGKVQRYVDFPITDVLQMIGRAGRPQFGDTGVAVVFVHDMKKDFYKKFLHEPFPVESSLLQVFPDHMNAEIVAGTLTTTQDCLEYLTWTYLFRRLLQNPSYYGLESTETNTLNKFLSGLVDRTIRILQDALCVEVDIDERTLIATPLGKIASFYYLSHETIRMFHEELTPDSSLKDLLDILTQVKEYEELPVRHNEDLINSDLAKQCSLEVPQQTFDSARTKAHLLFQAHFSRLALPCTDYYTDLKSVLDQAIRILQAMIDVLACRGWLSSCLRTIIIMQMVVQARWFSDSTLLTLPRVEQSTLYCFRPLKSDSLPELMYTVGSNYEKLAGPLRNQFEESHIDEIFQVLQQLPRLKVMLYLEKVLEDGTKQERIPIPLDQISGVYPDNFWIPVHSQQQYVLTVVILRKNAVSRQRGCKAHAPKFPKPKDEGWFIVLGDLEKKELIALKRIGSVTSCSTQHLTFMAPEKLGRVRHTFYMISDSYLGLDQQYTVCLDVK